ERRQYTPFFKFNSTEVNLLTTGCFVGQNGGCGVLIGSIACQSNSRLKVNLVLQLSAPGMTRFCRQNPEASLGLPVPTP
ncbi:MAG: hypothetical protein ACRCZO_14530, partial [Cetobacterium sp.]